MLKYLSDFIASLPSNDKLKSLKTTKDNISLAAVIYRSLGESANVLNNIIKAALDEDKIVDKNTPKIYVPELDTIKRKCVDNMMAKYNSGPDYTLYTTEERIKASHEAFEKCGMNDKPKVYYITTSPVYSDIMAELNKINNLMSDIYRESSSREIEAFQKMTGFSYYGQQGLTSLLYDNKWVPQPGYLYSLQGAEALQTINKGILINTHNPYFPSKVAFIYTDKNFVDGQSLDGYYAYSAGTYRYQSNTGPRNICKFRLNPTTVPA